MTIDEKLSHFYDVTIEDARAKAAGILEEHRKALAQMTENTRLTARKTPRYRSRQKLPMPDARSIKHFLQNSLPSNVTGPKNRTN